MTAAGPIEAMSEEVKRLVVAVREVHESVGRMEVDLGRARADIAKIQADINGNGGPGIKMEVDRLKRREGVQRAAVAGRWTVMAQALTTLGAVGVALAALLRG